MNYLERAVKDNGLQPVKKESIARVPGSSALRMFDHSYIATPRSLASEGAPIVFNNACASWHRLAESFTFANARAYIGTLFSVTDSEAQEVAVRLLGHHFGKPLSVALWRAQNEVYGKNLRRPYVLVGTHFQRMRGTAQDAPMLIFRKLRSAHSLWIRQLRSADPTNESAIRRIRDHLRFLRAEMERIHERWIANRDQSKQSGGITL